MLDTAPDTKTAADLGIPQDVYDALLSVATDLETGKLKHKTEAEWESEGRPKGQWFNMDEWNAYDCGSVCCIGGWTEQRIKRQIAGPYEGHFVNRATWWGGTKQFVGFPGELADLFYPDDDDGREDITPTQAARAIRHYLSTGIVDWPLAVSAG